MSISKPARIVAQIVHKTFVYNFSTFYMIISVTIAVVLPSRTCSRGLPLWPHSNRQSSRQLQS